MQVAYEAADQKAKEAAMFSPLYFSVSLVNEYKKNSSLFLHKLGSVE